MVPARLRQFTVAVSLSALTVGGVWALGISPAAAATTDRYVATENSHATDTDNDCTSSATPCKTIQHAVDVADPGDTIRIGAGTYPESVQDGVNVGSGGSGVANLTFAGAGVDATKITGSPSSSSNVGFGIGIEGESATVRDLAVTGVQRPTGSTDGFGVGILAEGAQLTLVDVSASGNADDGVAALATDLNASGSTFDHNGTSANLHGLPDCGVFAEGGTTAVTTSSASSNGICGIYGLGSEDQSTSTLQVTRSAIDGNGGPGLLAFEAAAAAVSDSTLVDNAGGGVFVGDSTVSVVHATITGTKAFTQDEIPDQAAIAVEDETTDATARAVSPSRAAAGIRKLNARLRGLPARLRDARVRSEAAPTASVVTVAGSIIADNTVPDCSKNVTDGGYNISGDAKNSCGFSATDHSQTSTDPMLGALGDHGGLTETQLPLKGSPAIDAQPAGATGCTTGSVDQRGVARPQPTGGRCDIGSVELAADPLAISPDSLQHGTVGKAYHETLTATGGQYPTYTWSLTDGTLPPGIAFADGVFSGTPTKAGTYTVTISVNDPATRTYSIVIDAAATKHSSDGTGSKLADTGVSTLAMSAIGMLFLMAGLLALYAAGLIGRQGGRHRVPLA